MNNSSNIPYGHQLGLSSGLQLSDVWKINLNQTNNVLLPKIYFLKNKRLAIGCTTLMYACQQGNTGVILEHIRAKQTKIHCCDNSDKNVLHYCAVQKQSEPKDIVAAASLAIAAPELLDSADEDGFTPLHLAVIQGNLAMVNLLLANSADVNAVDNEGHSVVHWATVCGEVEILRAIILAGANITIADINGGSPLHYAAQMCGTPYDLKTTLTESSKLALDILGILIIHPQCNVNVQDKDGRQPILWAASAGSSKAVAALVKAGAKVESADKDGLTALHCAASRGHTECIDTLISLCGAPTDLIDSNGSTALHYAVTIGHADATAKLLELDADPNRQDRKGRSPAHCGCAKGQLETLKILKLHGANLWLRNAKGDLPIHEATMSGRCELIEWLLLQKIQHINTTSNDGRSMLHIAANHNYADICKILLDYGANINATYKNVKGTLVTPLDSALQKGHRSTAKFLQSQGGLPATKLYINTQNSNSLKSLSTTAVSPKKSEKESDNIDLIDSQKIIVFIKDICCEKYKYAKIHKHGLCRYREKENKNNSCKLNKFYYFRRRSNSCHDKKKKDCFLSNLYRSKSNLEIRCKLLQYNDANFNKTDDSDSCINCSCHKCIKHHIVCQKRKKKGINTKIKYSSDSEEHSSTNDKKLKNDLNMDYVIKPEIDQSNDTLLYKNHPNDLITPEVFKKKAENVVCIDASTSTSNIIFEDSTNLQSKGKLLENDFAQTSLDSTAETKFSINEQQLESDKIKIEAENLEEEITITNNTEQDSIIKSETSENNSKLLNLNNTELENVNSSILEYTITGDNIKDSNEHDISVPDTNEKKNNEKPVQDDVNEVAHNFEMQRSEENLSEELSVNKMLQNNSNNCKKSMIIQQYSEDNIHFFDYFNENDKTPKTKLEKKITNEIKEGLPYSDINKSLVYNSSDNENFRVFEKVASNSSFQILSNDNDLNDINNFEADNKSNLNTSPVFTVLTDKNTDYLAKDIRSETESNCNKCVKSRMNSDNTTNHNSTELEILKEQKKIKDKVRESFFEIGSCSKSSKIPVPKKNHNYQKDSRQMIKFEFPSHLENNEHCRPGNRNACNMESVTKSIQSNIKRYYMERKIFQHFLELKSMQIHSNKYNESILVKRAVNEYHKTFGLNSSEMGMSLPPYKSNEYTFKNFELFLYETLKRLQKPGSNNFCNIKKVYTEAERHLNLDYKTCTSALQCTSKTHRCFHAIHAYTGIPCAAYIPMINHHTIPKIGFGSNKNCNMRGICLPKITTSRYYNDKPIPEVFKKKN